MAQWGGTRARPHEVQCTANKSILSRRGCWPWQRWRREVSPVRLKFVRKRLMVVRCGPKGSSQVEAVLMKGQNSRADPREEGAARLCRMLKVFDRQVRSLMALYR